MQRLKRNKTSVLGFSVMFTSNGVTEIVYKAPVAENVI